MKRNILKVGKSSLAVSLPKAFVNFNNLDSGQEIEVEKRGNSLTITCEQNRETYKEIDLTDLQRRSC